MDDDEIIEQEHRLTDKGLAMVETFVREWRNGWSIGEICLMHGIEEPTLLTLLSMVVLQGYELPEDRI